MEIVSQTENLRQLMSQARATGKTIGLVPTMGFLHQGHQALMIQAKAQQDVVVASIFVNPLQFGPNEDYAAYPRDLAKDAALAAAAGVDVLFTPTVECMYPQGVEKMVTFVEVQHLTQGLCGASRPGHFRGVTTVVSKLFNLVQPDVAYFGQKDAQQVSVIKQMVADLNIPVAIVAVPIVREEDGLALSSRNIFLNPAQRQAALVLSRSLQLAARQLAAGERQAHCLRQAMAELIIAEPLAVIDYIAICDPATLEDVKMITGTVLLALAVKIGNTRLIDNLVWEC